MRITQNMMTRNYLSGLNRSMGNLAKSNARMSSGRKFERVWEDTASASKAFTVRERLYKSEQFAQTIESANGELSSAESNLLSINSMLTNVNEKVSHALNGATSKEARETIAQEIGNIKKQVMQIANSKFGDKFLFGGSNNSTAAFSEVGGKLHFNGIDVDSITKDADGNFVYPDPVNTGDMIAVPQSQDRFLDIGLGLVMDGDKVNQKSAFKVSTSGLDALGFGTEDGSSKAIFNILNSIEQGLRSEPFDKAAVEKSAALLKKQTDNVLMSVTDIGSKAGFLEQMKDRFDNDILNLKTEQKSLESISYEEESIYNSEYYAAWMVSLKLGSKLIPPSLFDFMN